MANAYADTCTVLVQFMLRGHPELPGLHDRDQGKPTATAQNKSEEILHLKVASGNDLPGVLSQAGLTLVDAYYQRKVDKSDKPYTVLTFLFGERIADNDLDDTKPRLLAYFLGKHWDQIVVRRITNVDDVSHFFHTVVFSGNGPVGEIAPERLKLVKHEAFGLVEIRSKGKSKPREDRVLA